MASTFKFEKDFTDYLKGYVCGRLDELEDLETYGCDLAFEVTLDVNNDQHELWNNDDEALDFIKRYPSSALAAIECHCWNFGREDLAHVLRDWSTLAFFMLYHGCNSLVNECQLIQDSWDDEIHLDAETIERLKDEVMARTEITY